MKNLKAFQDFLDQMIKVCSGRQAEFYKAMKDDLKDCELVSVKNLFSEEEIAYMRTLIAKKECYKNAAQIAIYLSNPDRNIEYVEGRAMVAGFPVEHAWNKVDDKYFDATFELLLGYDVTKETYALLREYKVAELMECLEREQCYSEFYPILKYKTLFSTESRRGGL